ncbi:ketosteroid isomerase-like protein [Bradyrhizobium diazoefficiens]
MASRNAHGGLEGGSQFNAAGEPAVTCPKDVVLNAWKTFSSRDAERIAALFTDDAEWIASKGNATAVVLDHTDHMHDELLRESSRLRRVPDLQPRGLSG